MDYTDIKKVCKTTSDTEANRLLGEGWKLYDIEKNGSRYTFLLVQI